MQYSGEVVIRNKYGFHVRPSTSFVKIAQGFSAKISVEIVGGTPVDGKIMMMLMTLGAGCGAHICIRADGEDAQEAVAALVAHVESGFGGID